MQRESRIEGHLMYDHMHMLVSIPPKYEYPKGKSALVRTLMGKRETSQGESFWANGYFVSTVGRDEEQIREYIQKQEREDQQMDQPSRGWP